MNTIVLFKTYTVLYKEKGCQLSPAITPNKG
jgi:hypothetical protein